MEHILKNIATYLKSDDTNGAFQVRGEWGSGKTYFFKKMLPEKIREDVPRLQVMISLFGMKGVEDIPFKLLNAYISKKSEMGEDASEDMNRALDYLDMKYGENPTLREVNLHDDEELIYNIIPRDEVYLCLDDVERFVRRDNVEEMMGAVNNLVENLGYKVVLIFNDHYQKKDNDAETVKSKFKEKVIGNAVTFLPDVEAVLAEIVDEYGDEAFSAFMKRDDVLGLFLPQRRNRAYRKDFENIRNMKFAVSKFFGVFGHYRNALDNDKTVRSLKYYLAFIIGVAIEYKKDILTDGDTHGIEYDEDVFAVNLADDDEDVWVEELFRDYEETADQIKRREKREKFDSVFRRRFYSVYAKDIGQKSIFHTELFNHITMGLPINYGQLEANIEKKLFALEKAENPGNVIVSQTLDGSIFNYSDDEIREKMLVLLSSVENSSLMMLAAYVNAFSFLDMYKTVIGKSYEVLFEVFKRGISGYIARNEINQMERTGMEMVSDSIPEGTKAFYNYMRDELHKKWEASQSRGLDEMTELFKTDMTRFCGLFCETQGRVTVRYNYNSDAVLYAIPEEVVVERVQHLTPKEVHELSRLLAERYRQEDIYAFQLHKEKSFLEAIKRGVEAIEGDDTVSKVEAKSVLLNQAGKALRNMTNR